MEDIKKDIFDRLEEEDLDIFDSVEAEDNAISSIKTQVSDILNKFDSTRRSLENKKMTAENSRITEELKAFIKEEIAKIKPIQNVVERIIEKQLEQVVRNVQVPVVMPPLPPEIIKEVKIIEKEVLKDDGKKYVEEKTLEELKLEIEEIRKKLNSTDLQKIWPNMRLGKIIPSMSNQQGKVLGNTGNKLVWVNGSASYLDDLLDVDDSARQPGFVLMFDGTNWIAAAQGTTFAFAIASFSDGNSGTIEIGAGVWKAIGALSFTASYTNGPATGGDVSFSGWTSDLTLTNSFQGPTTNAEAVNYPSVGGTVTFSLQADKSAESDTDTIVHTFVNRRFFDVSTVTGSYTEADVESWGNELSNSKAKSYSVTAGASEYLVWASPVRLGTVTFTVGGFAGGFLPPETVSITNGSGFTENYYVYRSVNSNLGTVDIVTS